jgi:replicative DNA helicase
MTPLEKNEFNEASLLGYAYADAQVIDRATQAGVTAEAFIKPEHHHQWRFLCELRLRGLGTDSGTVIQEAVAAGRVGSMGGIPHIFQCADLGSASPGGAGPCIDRILDVHAKRQAYKLLAGAVEHLTDGGGDLDTVRQTVERVAGICAGNGSVQRGLSDIADEAIKDAEEQIRGEKASRTLIYTGLPTFDKYATPMEMHEYVVVGARTSHGKSSFLLQVAGHNLSIGRRVAIFTLETSDKSVLKQIVAQRCQVNVRQIHMEMPPKQQEYLSKLRVAKDAKNLLIFDRDSHLKAIEARCRLLATSFKPDLVIIDYMGLINTGDRETMQRITTVSKAMIDIRKALGCCLMIGAQFSREVEKASEGPNPRQPVRTDFRDCGSVEEDAHRIIALWREPKQALDLDYFDSAILQLKLRDGGLASIRCRFHAPTTRFVEAN